MNEQTMYVVAVTALIFRNGKVLAMRRARTKDAGAGAWETLSGRVNENEQPLDAVRRETHEECGLAVDFDTRPLGALQTRRGELPMLVVYYRAESPAGEVVMSDEHDDWAWLDPEEFARRTPFAMLADMVRRAAALERPGSESEG